MKDLIQIAEEQIKHLEKIECNKALGVEQIEISKEIREWSEFIYKLNINRYS